MDRHFPFCFSLPVTVCKFQFYIAKDIAFHLEREVMLQNKYRWLIFFSFHSSLSSSDKHLPEHSTADCVLCLYLFVLWSVRRCTLRINRSQAGAFKPQLDLLVLYQKLQVHLILELGDSKTTLRYLWLLWKTTTPIRYLDSIEATTISRSTDRRT